MKHDYDPSPAPEGEKGKKPKSPNTSRRTLLAIGGAGSLVAVAGPVLANVRYLFPNVLYGTPPTAKLKPPEEYPPDSFTFHEKQRLFVINDRHGFRAISAICTHLRCTIGPFVSPDKKYNTIHSHCPCHGSVFDKDGNVLKGPAPRPLPFYRLTLSPDERLVVNTMKVVEPDRFFKV